MNFFGRIKTLIIVSLCLYSCASGAAIREDRPFVYLTNSAEFTLLEPENIRKKIDMAQQISASFGNQEYFINAWVQADDSGMDITLLNELGANMGELSYRNGSLSFSSSVFPQSLKPEYIVADFQLCFYRTIPLRWALEACGLSLEESGAKRLILQDKTPIIEIEQSSGSIKLTNYLRGYSYTLEGEF